jgi:hypothetical protein
MTRIRKSLDDLKYKIEFLGGDIDERDIDLRNILMEMLKLIDKVLPVEVEDD